MMHKTRRVLYLFSAWMLLCSACSQSSEKGEAWSISESGDLDIKRPEGVDLTPRGARPIEIPANSFPWLPKDKDIIVHTAMESYTAYESSNELVREFTKTAALRVQLILNPENPYIPRNPQSRLWVAFDLEGMQFNDLLHFFEVRANRADPIVGSRFRFAWLINEDFLFSTGIGAYEIDIYIKEDITVSNGDMPNVAEPWSSLADMSNREYVPVKMYVWYPEQDVFHTIQLRAKYAPAEYPPLLPRVSMFE